jgi:hypothetical protein
MTIVNNIVCLCGKRRVGKNTAAPDVFQCEMSFAEPIKRCVAQLFDFSEDQVDGDEKDLPDRRWEGVTPRRVLQFSGRR